MDFRKMFKLWREKVPIQLGLSAMRVPEIRQPMKIYLTTATKYAEKLPALQLWIEHQGHRVVSSWWNRTLVDDKIKDICPAPCIDRVELDECDAIIIYPGDFMSVTSLIEVGYGLGLNKQLFHLGRRPINDPYLRRYMKPWPVALPFDFFGDEVHAAKS